MLEPVYILPHCNLTATSLQPLGYAASESRKYTIFNVPGNSKIISYPVVSNSEMSGQRVSESGISIWILHVYLHEPPESTEVVHQTK